MGIADTSHEIVGTTFSPNRARKGNEPLETWLSRLLVPHIPLGFHEIAVEGNPVALLVVGRAHQRPVSFSGGEFIRVGSATRKLRDYPEKERNLWRSFDRINFEDGIAAERIQDQDALDLRNWSAYFELSERPLPDDRSVMLDLLQRDALIAACPTGGWNITNVGAILCARNLQDFPGSNARLSG